MCLHPNIAAQLMFVQSDIFYPKMPSSSKNRKRWFMWCRDAPKISKKIWYHGNLRVPPNATEEARPYWGIINHHNPLLPGVALGAHPYIHIVYLDDDPPVNSYTLERWSSWRWTLVYHQVWWKSGMIFGDNFLAIFGAWLGIIGQEVSEKCISDDLITLW